MNVTYKGRTLEDLALILQLYAMPFVRQPNANSVGQMGLLVWKASALKCHRNIGISKRYTCSMRDGI